jgi:hypothetical protein
MTDDELADRLNVAWEILRHVTPGQLPSSLESELGPVIDDVLTAAARLREPQNPSCVECPDCGSEVDTRKARAL